MVAGDHVFGYLQIPYPAWYMYMKNNKIQAGIIMFFGLNLVSSWASSTGAFEIIYNGTILYSGIKTGRMPSVEEVMGILKNI